MHGSLDRLGAMVRTWWQRPHWFAELWSALVLMGFSAWSTTEPSALADMRSFHEVVRLMPEPMWDCATGVVGVAQFMALWADNRLARGAAAFAATVLLTALTAGAAMQFPSPLDVFPFGFVGINMFALGRAFGNAR